MSIRALLLTPWMAPHKIISWQRAVTLLYLGKVEVVEEAEAVYRAANDASGRLRFPAGPDAVALAT